MIAKQVENISVFFDGFRLLNSEIGNDLNRDEKYKEFLGFCFRLLNSEIGNDHDVKRIATYGEVFSSP